MKWPKESVEAETGIGTQVPGDDSTEFYLWASMDGWGCEGRVYESFRVPTDLGWAQHMVLFTSVGMRGAKAPKEWARALLWWCCQNPMDFFIAVIKNHNQKATWGEKALFGLLKLSHIQIIVHLWRKSRQERQGRNSETTEDYRLLVCYSWFPQFTSQDRLHTNRTAPKELDPSTPGISQKNDP